MSNEANRELARLWRVSRTVHEMVRDRVSLGTLCSDFGWVERASNVIY